MLRRLLSMTPGERLYIRLWSDRISVRNLDSGDVFDDEPLLAVRKGKRQTVEAVGGQEARLAASLDSAVELINPFDHPRSLIKDFDSAEAMLRYAVRQALGNRWFSPAPLVAMHPLDKLDGGLTDPETRVLRELGELVGASRVHIMHGHSQDDEMVRKVFRSG